MAHRAELQAKVEERRVVLKQALAATGSDSHQAERHKSLEAEIRLADDALQGGWDKVSEVGAAQLTKWLETSQSLVLPPVAAAAPKPAAATPSNEPPAPPALVP